VSIDVPVNATAARIRVSWSVPSGITASNYYIYRAAGATAAFGLIGTVAGTESFVTHMFYSVVDAPILINDFIFVINLV
jgi:hypothetical protein